MESRPFLKDFPSIIHSLVILKRLDCSFSMSVSSYSFSTSSSIGSNGVFTEPDRLVYFTLFDLPRMSVDLATLSLEGPPLRKVSEAC